MRKLLLLLVVILLISGGYLFWKYKDNFISKPQNHSSDSNNTNTLIDFNKIQWNKKSFDIEDNRTIVRYRNFKLQVNIPTTWTTETVSSNSNPDNFITNCTKFTFTSEDLSAQVILEPICTSWGAIYTKWPTDAVTVLEQRRNGNSASKLYRVRYEELTNKFNYVDGLISMNKTLDISMDKVMDVITIAYNSPYDANSDFYYCPAKLSFSYNGNEKDKEIYLKIADTIAASLSLIVN